MPRAPHRHSVSTLTRAVTPLADRGRAGIIAPEITARTGKRRLVSVASPLAGVTFTRA